MTGKETMFYASLVILILLVAVYLPVRGWIEVQKWKTRKNIQHEKEKQKDEEE